jgi:predicted alpha/beta hydrolase family esterase
MKQIVIIGGGNVFASWTEFLIDWVSHGFYTDWRIQKLFQKHPKSWKANLETDLQQASLTGRDGSNYHVLRLDMPQSYNARYDTWKKAFEKAVPQMKEEVILVGHSLGALFLVKYLSEEIFPKKILATFLVSAPFDKDGNRTMPYFTLPKSLTLFEKQSPFLCMYHSKDDPVVYFSEFERLHAALPTVQTRIFGDRGHFWQEHFPELVQDIRNFS